jgi:hypothetical protein
MKGTHGHGTGRRALPPHAADGAGDGSATAADRGLCQPAGKRRAGVDLFAGSDFIDGPAPGGDGSGGHGALPLDVAQADVFHYWLVVGLSSVCAVR